MNKNILDVYDANNIYTDKYTLGYLDNFYQKLFDEQRIESILEIGIHRGESIRLWRCYFDNDVDIHGVDIKECKPIPNTSLYQDNAYSEIFASKFKDNYLDLVIDDGPHTYESWINLIDLFYDKISYGGSLVIEDIILPMSNMGATREQIKDLITYAKEKGFIFVDEKLMMGLQKTEPMKKAWSEHLSILHFVKPKKQ